MDQIELLISSCNISLTLLMDQYKKGRITYDDFISNSKLKIAFLKEHMENIQSIKERALAKQILLQCEQISTLGPPNGNFNCDTKA